MSNTKQNNFNKDIFKNTKINCYRKRKLYERNKNIAISLLVNYISNFIEN